MVSTVPSSSQGRDRPQRRSRFGCRNCKLRRVKCDESKPNCKRCKDYEVSCNFTIGIPDLQVLTTAEFQCQNVVSENRLALNATLPTTLNPRINCSDGIISFVMDAYCLARLERFRMATLSSFSPEMTRIWQNRIPHLALENPYLMHTMLALAASHERQQYAPIDSKQNRIEAYHHLQSILLFNQKLSRPIEASDKDPIWATAALVGMLTLASFDPSSPEEAWPLRPSNPSNLEWFRIGDRKKVIWDLTDPLRSGGIFSTMAHEYAQRHIELPTAGDSGLPSSLAQVCNISSLSNKENNPYFVAAHLLVQMQRLSDTNARFSGIQMVNFMSQSEPGYRNLLWEKDPVALLLLALWYDRAGRVLWWVERRAHMETRAIRLYLERIHGGESRILQLLPVHDYHIIST